MPSWLRESRCLYEGGRGTAGTWSAKKTRRKNFSSRNDACKDRFESRRGAPRNRKERMGVQGRFRMGGMRSLRSQQAVVSFAGNRVRRNHLGVKIIRKRDDRKEKREDANDGTTSIRRLYVGCWRDPAHRYRQRQTAATVTASQTRLRKVSIDVARATPSRPWT